MNGANGNQKEEMSYYKSNITLGDENTEQFKNISTV